MEFVTVCRVDELPYGHKMSVEVDGRGVVIAYIYGEYYAFEDRCPHQGLPLSNCFFTSGDVVCAWHGAAFNLKTGSERGGPEDGDLEVFAIRVQGDDLQVERRMKTEAPSP
jgi:3-phenylpropionate/trans-cinnamate dioxygenase ferredoxin subunit